MTTTLTEARAAVIKLSAQFPAPSTYADLLTKIADYLDNQVPLKVENDSLAQRNAVLESAFIKVRNALPDDGSIVTIALPTGDITRTRIPARKPIDCTAWMGLGCKCGVCAGMRSDA